MVVDIRERRQPEWVGGPDLGAQVGDVGLRGAVAPFVFALGVDHQAVGPVGDRLGAEVRLAGGVRPVDELPRAHFQAVRVQLGDQFGAELAPVVARPVGALHEQRRHVGRVRLGDDRGEVAAVGGAHVPDPHALAFEGRARGRGGGRSGDDLRRRGWVQRVAHDRDRPVGARVARMAEQHHDVPGVGLGGDGQHEALLAGAQMCARARCARRGRPAWRGRPRSCRSQAPCPPAGASHAWRPRARWCCSWRRACS